jgi:hypothetical protein
MTIPAIIDFAYRNPDVKYVVLSLCPINYVPTREDVWGIEGTALPLLTPLTEKGECSTSRSNRFALREWAPGTHWIGGWVGPRDDLGTAE